MTYTGQTSPSSNLDPRIVPFLERFYSVSDNPDTHDQYVDAFTEKARFIMGTKSVSGHYAIRTLREGLWSGPIQTRKHHLGKIYPFGDQKGLECMLEGTVDYVLRNGKEVTVEWAGRAVLEEDGEGKLRFAFYQVYLDSAPVAQAAKED